MLRWANLHKTTILPTLLAVGLALGWSMRERTFAADKAKLLESKTLTQADIKLEEFVYEGKPRGEIGIYFKGETAGTRDFVVGQFRLKPGEEPHPIHKHAEEEVMIVTAGVGEIICDGKTTKIGAGAVMFTEPNVPHGIKNTGKEPLTFYFLKYTGVSR